MTKEMFEQMVVNRAPHLHQAALKLTQNSEQARDLVQDTLLLALKNQQRFAEGSRVEAWLYTIMRNSFINGYRRDKQRRQVLKRLETTGWPANETRDHSGGFSRVLTRTIQQYLEELPRIYRNVLQLRLNGYQYAEIAEATGENLGTIKSRIHVAKDLLKKKLLHVLD